MPLQYHNTGLSHPRGPNSFYKNIWMWYIFSHFTKQLGDDSKCLPWESWPIESKSNATMRILLKRKKSLKNNFGWKNIKFKYLCYKTYISRSNMTMKPTTFRQTGNWDRLFYIRKCEVTNQKSPSNMIPLAYLAPENPTLLTKNIWTWYFFTTYQAIERKFIMPPMRITTYRNLN